MKKFPQISLAEAFAVIHRRPALIVGPSATQSPGQLDDLAKIAAKVAKVHEEDVNKSNSSVLIDRLRSENPSKAAVFERELLVGLRSLKPIPDISHLTKAGWSACISLTEDLIFENALRVYLDSLAGTRALTIIDSARIVPPVRTIPVYKLFGNLISADEDSKLALSEADCIIRQQ